MFLVPEREGPAHSRKGDTRDYEWNYNNIGCENQVVPTLPTSRGVTTQPVRALSAKANVPYSKG